MTTLTVEARSQTLTVPAGSIYAPAYDWYVDSVNGSDAYGGKLPMEPFKTIAKLMTVMGAGDSVAFAKGSHWRETYSPPGIGCTAVAYGSGADPILDCRDVAANANFTKTVGQTNVYQITISPELSAGGTFNSVWEDDVRLVRATSVANCDATPGSYYPSSEVVAPITMYAHASDSSSLITNGKVYLYSQRQYSVESYAYTGIGLNGIVGIGNLGESGSFRIGKSSILYNCQALEGNKHNIYVGTGCWLEDVTATDAYYGAAGGFTLFVHNENTPANEGITYTNCIAQMTTYSAYATGFYGHYNVSGSFGTVTYDSCSAIKCGLAFDGISAAYVYNDCVITTAAYGFGYAGAVTRTINGGTFTGITGRLISATSAASCVAIVNGLTYSQAAGQIVFSNQEGFNLTIQNSTLTISNSIPITQLEGANTVVVADHNSYNIGAGGNSYVYYMTHATSTNITSDYNNFNKTNSWFSIGGTVYASVALYQAATGQDAHSTIG